MCQNSCVCCITCTNCSSTSCFDCFDCNDWNMRCATCYMGAICPCLACGSLCCKGYSAQCWNKTLFCPLYTCAGAIEFIIRHLCLNILELAVIPKITCASCIFCLRHYTSDNIYGDLDNDNVVCCPFGQSYFSNPKSLNSAPIIPNFYCCTSDWVNPKFSMPVHEKRNFSIGSSILYNVMCCIICPVCMPCNVCELVKVCNEIKLSNDCTKSPSVIVTQPTSF